MKSKEILGKEKFLLVFRRKRKYNKRNVKNDTVNRRLTKATIYKFLQRADGWCESVKG